MDYGNALKRAWQITWRHKYLWFFGFFTGSAVPGGAGGGGHRDGSQSNLWDAPRFIAQIRAGDDVLTLFLIVAIVALVLVLLFLGVVARGALARCAYDIDAGKPSSFSQGWHSGVQSFWQILGIGLLLGLVVLGYLVVIGGPLVLIGVLGGRGWLITAVVLGILAFLALIPIAIAIQLINEFALREAALKGTGVRESVGNGWKLIRSNLRPALVVWLIQLGIGVGAVTGVLLGALILAIPFFLLALATPNWWGLIPGMLLGIVYFVLTTAVLGTFTSALWTMAYKDLQSGTPLLPPSSPPSGAEFGAAGSG